MAFSTISVGAAADDNTGDTNRAGWQKVNANFADAQTQINTKAAAADLAAEIATRESDVTSLTAALATKADAADIVDPSDIYPRYDAAAVLINDDKRTLAANTGAMASLAFPLVASATDVATGTIDLPFFPQSFIIIDVFVMLHKRTVGSGGTLSGAFTLDQGATNIALQTTSPITGAAKMQGTIAVAGRRITKELATSVSLTIGSTETGSPVAKGATLWLRGVWEA